MLARGRGGRVGSLSIHPRKCMWIGICTIRLSKEDYLNLKYFSIRKITTMPYSSKK